MNKGLLHRYKIWQLAGNGQPQREQTEPAASRQVEDLVALMALYDYRPLIEAEFQGTCTLPNGASTRCRTTTISADSVNLVYDSPAAPAAKRSEEIRMGAAVHLNLDQIGALHGVVASKKPEGLRVAVDEACKPMLRTKLSRMAATQAVALENGSGAAKSALMKVEPAIRSCSFIDHTGTLRRGVVVNVSQVDALIKARIVPPLKSRVTFRGKNRHMADVARTFEMGFAVRFCSPIPAEEFSVGIKFSDD